MQWISVKVGSNEHAQDITTEFWQLLHCEKSTLDLVMLIFGKFAECIVRIVSVGLQHHQYMVQLPG